MDQAPQQRCPVMVRVEIDGVVVQRRAELRVLQSDSTGRATIGCMTPILEEGEILCERVGAIPIIVRAPGLMDPPKSLQPISGPIRDMQIRTYRDHLIRVVFGQRSVLALKDSDSIALDRVCERLADAEDAQRILRSKGYGRPWSNLVELARLMPDAPRRVGAGGKR